MPNLATVCFRCIFGMWCSVCSILTRVVSTCTAHEVCVSPLAVGVTRSVSWGVDSGQGGCEQPDPRFPP